MKDCWNIFTTHSFVFIRTRLIFFILWIMLSMQSLNSRLFSSIRRISIMKINRDGLVWYSIAMKLIIQNFTQKLRLSGLNCGIFFILSLFMSYFLIPQLKLWHNENAFKFFLLAHLSEARKPWSKSIFILWTQIFLRRLAWESHGHLFSPS